MPLFVFDRALLARFGAANRVAFLLDALGRSGRVAAHARRGTRGARGRRRGGDDARRARLAARRPSSSSEDVSAYAQARERRLGAACEEQRLALSVLPGVTVVPPGELAPAGAECYRVFTPYWRRWQPAPRRASRRRRGGSRCLPASRAAGCRRSASSARHAVPAAAARRRVGGTPPADELAGSRPRAATTACTTISPPTARRGSARTCTSAASRRSSWPSARAAARAREPFVRQLCLARLLRAAARGAPGDLAADFRPRGRRWRDDATALAAWKEGRTGYPIIDAGMRQLAREGFMHNRARLLTASFLTKDLGLDWRLGAAHFAELLVDGDVANNSGNWQWVAGTGVDTRPNRVFNPIAQAKRFDPAGDYVRRYVPELAGVEGRAVHEPWKLARQPPGYPEPIVDHARGGGAAAPLGILGRMTSSLRRGSSCAPRISPTRATPSRSTWRRSPVPRALAGALQPRVPARLRRVAAPVPADPPARARGGAAAHDRPLGRGHLHHRRAAQRRLVHHELPPRLRAVADAVPRGLSACRRACAHSHMHAARVRPSAIQHVSRRQAARSLASVAVDRSTAQGD